MKNVLIKITICLLSTLACNFSHAKIVSELVDYKDGDTTLQGFFAYDDAKKEKLPTVLLVHDWMGLAQNTKDRALQVAQLGYFAFALDIYGKGVRPQNAVEAAKLAGSFKSNRKLLRTRAQSGLEFIKLNKHVDAQKVVVAGYCFGGTTALEMGRAGLDLKGVVSFHGGLESPTPLDAKNFKGEVLVMHGALDPYVSAAEVSAFEKEMNDAKVDYSLIKYSGAVHSFTIKEAGSDIKTGAAYNAKADQKSWAEFKGFLARVF